MHSPRRILRFCLALLVTAAVAVALPTGASAASCAGTDVAPGADNLGRVSSATLCLLNAERERRGLKPLERDRRLDAAALKQSRDMVRRQYFAHESPEGRHSSDRIRASGYLADALAWIVGENLAWGTGALATPRAIVAAWMESPGHRANILERRYRDIGLGVVTGNPVAADGAGATFATTFGGASRAAAAAKRPRAQAAKRAPRRRAQARPNRAG